LNKLAWAVQGKGKGTAKLNKDADYIAVHAMNQDSHLSNVSMANSVSKTVQAYLRDKRILPENVQKLNELIRLGAAAKGGSGLENFPGLDHPDAETAIKGLTFDARKKMFQILDSVKAQNLGAPSVSKIARSTLGEEGAGVPYGHAMMLLEVPRGASQALVHLAESGLPVHPSYDWGIHGRVVGRFAHPVAPEILHQPWFDAKNEENKTKVTEKGNPPNLRRSFEMALPVTTITQDIADKMPHAARDIQSSKAAQLALNAFNDHWHNTDTAVNQGGVGAADFSRALRNSDSSSTLSQYSEKDINDMKKSGSFTGYKLKNGEVYFGLKRGTNYAEDYGFEHPELTPHETSLVNVVNNEPGAKGIGGAPVVLKAIQHGATALDAYAVPTDKHPHGFLPDFYSHFGFRELGRIPFDPQYVTEQQLADMKHEWRKTGWDEDRHGMPSMSIMKWKGSDADRADAVRRFVAQGGEGFGESNHQSNVRSASQPIGQGAGPATGEAPGQRGLGDASGDRGPVRTDNVSRPADRFIRTLSAIKGLTPSEVPHFGLDPNEIAIAKARGLATGGNVVDRALSVVRQHAPTHNHVIFDPSIIDIKRRYKRGGGVEGFSGGGTPGEDDPGIQKTLGIARQLTPQGLYSHGAEVAAALPQAKGTPQQMQAMLIARGVKPEEMKWSGTQNTFSGQHSVTKDQLAQQFQQGMPDIRETVLSNKTKIPPRHADHQLPGANTFDPEKVNQHIEDKAISYALESGDIAHKKEWHEANDDVKNWHIDAAKNNFNEQMAADPFFKEQFVNSSPGGGNYREILLHTPEIAQHNQTYYPPSSHYDQNNLLGHIRVSDRDAGDTLHLEELQSDWGQQARKFGVSKPYNANEIQLIHPENILDEKHKRDFWNFKTPTGTARLPKNRYPTVEDAIRHLTTQPVSMGVPPAPYIEKTENWTDLLLKRALKEAAEGGYKRMVWSNGPIQESRWPGSNLSTFYDQMLPKRLQDIVKRLGHKAILEHHTIDAGNGDITLPSIRMTPELRDSISKGMPAYAHGGNVIDHALSVVRSHKPHRR
jgi:hypothetical protein